MRLLDTGLGWGLQKLRSAYLLLLLLKLWGSHRWGWVNACHSTATNASCVCTGADSLCRRIHCWVRGGGGGGGGAVRTAYRRAGIRCAIGSAGALLRRRLLWILLWLGILLMLLLE
jgi:hypothetical protein